MAAGQQFILLSSTVLGLVRLRFVNFSVNRPWP